MSTPFTGKTASCFCGECTLTVTDEPKGCFFCHCEQCRHVSGQPFICGAPFDPKALDVKGKTQKATVKGASVTKMETVSCKKCHGLLYNTNKFDLHVVPVCSLGMNVAANAGAHIFYKERVVDVEDDKPKFKDLPKAFGGSDEMHDGSSLAKLAEGTNGKNFQCYCGKTKVSVKGDPKGMFLCHCNECRAISKQPCIEGAVFASEDLAWEGKVATTVAKKPDAKNDKGMGTKHCNNCNMLMANTNKFGFEVLPVQRLNGGRAGAQIFYKERKVNIKDPAGKFLDLPKELGGSGDMYTPPKKKSSVVAAPVSAANDVAVADTGCKCIIM